MNTSLVSIRLHHQWIDIFPKFILGCGFIVRLELLESALHTLLLSIIL